MPEIREADMVITVHLNLTTQHPGDLGPLMLAVTKRLQDELEALSRAEKLDLPESQTFVSVGKVLGAGIPR